MMIGEPRHQTHPTVEIPSWPLLDDLTDENELLSPYSPYNITTTNTDTNTGADFNAVNSPSYRVQDIIAALQRYLPSNNVHDGDFDSDAPLDAYSCDHFRMYEFKVRKCARGRAHDWTECPYAHPGEKARRRDPRKYHYSGAACPDFRKGNCRKGDACEYAHGVFECWLHPARYRTQPCKDGSNCRRRVCFFAHTPEQLRVVTPHSPVEASRARTLPFLGSPSTDSPEESPPMTPTLSRSFGSGYGSGSSSVNEVMFSLRNLQLLDKGKSFNSSWNMHGSGSPSGSGSGFGSPRRALFRPGFSSLPTTPTDGMTRVGYSDLWERGLGEEPVMERVESGRDLRVKMFEKLSKENFYTAEPGGAPDVGWVSDLVQ